MPERCRSDAHAPQPGLDVAISGVQAVEMGVGHVGLALRGQDRHDDEGQKAQQRDARRLATSESASAQSYPRMARMGLSRR